MPINIGEIFSQIRNGLTVKNDMASGGVPITRIETISDGSINYDKVGYSGIEHGTYKGWLLESGDILFSHINSIPHIGKCAIYEGIPNNLIHGMNLLMFRPNKTKLFPKFGLYLLRSGPFRSQLSKSIKPAVNQASVAISDIKQIVVNLPEFNEQKRIATILDKADAIRRKRQQAIQLADEFLRSVFLEMFGDPTVNSKGFPEKPIKDLAYVTTGNTPSREVPNYYGDFIEWIKSDNINTPSHYLTKAAEGLSEEGLCVGRSVPAGSTLITCIAGSPSCIGNAALADRPVSFNQQINALTPKPGIPPEFLYATTLFSKRRIQGASTNSMKGMVSKGALEEVLYICPSENDRDTFVNPDFS
jgi:type I restriction enzyme S subunit